MENLFSYITTFAKKAGRQTIETALRLYYAYHRPETPTWAKGVIAGALLYFVSPVDAIPDVTPIVGYADDAGVLLAAVTRVAFCIDDEVRDAASRKWQQWFGTGSPASPASPSLR